MNLNKIVKMLLVAKRDHKSKLTKTKKTKVSLYLGEKKK